MIQTQFSAQLLAWYDAHKRDLPWRRSRDPYRIWLSEVMLQQTRVAAVIPYYERFLERFPTVEALAQAREQELLAAWSGLGYYSRARNLQRAAKKIQDAGRFPSDYESIKQLPGIGDYTAAAVASIAFDLPHAVVDGNVLRVLSRITAERGEVRAPVTKSRLQELADRLIDRIRPGEFNQALMELGATVCLPRQPQCLLCPLTKGCEARRLGLQYEIPIRSTRAVPERQQKQVLVIEKRGKLLFWQRPADSRRLAGFWELPEPEQLPGARNIQRIGGFRHTIVSTHYRIGVLTGTARLIPGGFEWLDRRRLHEFPLSTRARKALACLEKQGAAAD